MQQAACRLEPPSGGGAALVSLRAKARPMSVLTLLERVLVPALVIFLLLGSAASAALGCALVFRTASAVEFMRRMNRWVSSRRALKGLEAPRQIGEARNGRSVRSEERRVGKE